MSRRSITLRGRRFIERESLLDEGTVSRVDEMGERDPLTGEWPMVSVYDGPMSVETYEAQESNPEVAGATLTVQRYIVKVPVGSFAPQIGDVVTITAAALDPNLAGREYRVVALLHKTAATAYRLGVEEVT